MLSRRDFLLLGPRREGAPATLSCERLYMRYLDSRLDGSTGELFERLARDLRAVTNVQLTDVAWLAQSDLKAHLDGVLDSFRARGGQVDVRAS
jgi:hypothetical protein